MREHAFTLWTSRFNSTETKPDFINERCFGEDFADWLRAKLGELGLKVSQPVQEDWGWCLVVSESQSKFTVSIGIMDESIGQVPAEWRVGVSYERALNGFLALFRPAPVQGLAAVGAKLEAVLANEATFAKLESAA